LASGQYRISSKDATTFNRIFKKTSSELSKLEKEFAGQVDQNIMQRDGTYVPRLVAITFAEDKGGIARNTWQSYASQALLNFDKDIAGMKGGSEWISKGDVAKARKWMEESKNDIIYKKLDYGNQKVLVMVKGNETITIPLTPQLAAQIPLDDPRTPSPEYQIIERAQNIYNGSTNASNVDRDASLEDKYRKAFFWPDGQYMPNIDRLNVKVDLTQDMTIDGMQYLNLLLKTELGVLPLKIDKKSDGRSAGLSRDQALNFIHDLTDDYVKQLYLESNKVPENWKEVIRNL